MNDYLALAKQVISIEKDALQRVSDNLDETFNHAISTLVECVKKKGKVVIVGVGKSGNIGHKLAATLNSTGVTAVVLNSQDALHGDIGLLEEDDVVIAMSYSGETHELINLIPFFKKANTQIIALTSKPLSTLGNYADFVLDTSVQQEACPLNLAPTSSSTAMLVLGDALAMALLEARGFTKEDFARFHPGGSLGKALLTRVSDIMRTGEDLAIVPATATVMETLKEISDKKTGICIIMDGEEMCGILTHGDFVRSYTADHDIGARIVKEVMTTSPITVQENLLAAEAINILRESRIDDLIVLNTDNYPVGVIDSQDLAKHKLL